ncbi:hypothetical protein NKT77_02610 [Moraxella sp. FZLJ2107]|uniref:hypothetical protein n=1 Tax=unclassified Moraxella TaxID=2685852 RepID=UPI0020C87FB9|nr:MULTISPECIES: hypothetical protein [unclassified Moraxella]UTO05561.1 hypothetical protein NKT77_02610 [Moraxella sp. FZLJ2107]UTO22297.1 hypothetical protein NKU06_10915 [Moraxella sp. FZLJ2109]
MRQSTFTKISASAIMVMILTGCQHIQVTRSPLPITLHPVTAPMQATHHSEHMTLPQKNKPKPSQAEQLRHAYLLEDWF